MLINIDRINICPAIINFNKELVPVISCSFHEAPVSEIIGETTSIRSSNAKTFLLLCRENELSAKKDKCHPFPFASFVFVVSKLYG